MLWPWPFCVVRGLLPPLDIGDDDDDDMHVITDGLGGCRAVAIVSDTGVGLLDSDRLSGAFWMSEPTCA